MQIYSVTEHINNLNIEIDKHVEFINNVKRMRELQKRCVGQPVTGLKDAEKIVDDFLAKGIKNNG